jgi:hypothetical protein
MKTSGIWLGLLCLVSMACVKDKVLTPTDQLPPMNVNTQAPPKSLGTFMSAVHPTSGTVKVLDDKTDPNIKYLVFENFKTDAGPDLRVYLATDTRATGFIEVSRLDKTGNFTLTIPASADLAKQTQVLIWCKQFSVLFGYAALK